MISNKVYYVAGNTCTFGKTLIVVGGVGAEAFWDEGGKAPQVQDP